MEICSVCDTPVKHSAAAACGHMHIQVIVHPACYLLREHEMGLWSCARCCLNIDQRVSEREREPRRADGQEGWWLEEEEEEEEEGDHIDKVEIIYF